MVPAILDDFSEKHNGRRPDLILHIGIAGVRDYYSIETLAHRDSYVYTDVDDRLGYEDGEKRWKELQLPPILMPGIPTIKLLNGWKENAPTGPGLQVSNDAGRYLCEFIFYTSLGQAELERRDRNVMFLHVPAAHREEDVEVGRAVTIALIKTLATYLIDRKRSQ